MLTLQTFLPALREVLMISQIILLLLLAILTAKILHDLTRTNGDYMTRARIENYQRIADSFDHLGDHQAAEILRYWHLIPRWKVISMRWLMAIKHLAARAKTK
jgi:hypothetical protein